MPGLFITFEGGEGAGKTTQVRLLRAALEAAGLAVEVTREPGGTPLGDEIRALLLDPASRRMTPLTEALLYAAGRAQHVAERIRPALDRGAVVLCDRFADASRAYQGGGRRVDAATIEALIQIATAGLEPDLTILLDVPAAEGLDRARRRNRDRGLAGHEDRFEAEHLEFHEAVRRTYLDLARRHPGRFLVLPARAAPEQVHRTLLAALADRLPELPRLHPLNRAERTA